MLASRSLATASEQKIESILRQRFPKARSVCVSDVSGGCGAMYQISIESEDFADLSILEQHRAVKQVLKNEIQNMHGLTIKTMI